jgi:hypothetical protein
MTDNKQEPNDLDDWDENDEQNDAADKVQNPIVLTEKEQKSYERFEELLLSGAKTLVGAYVGLLALDVSVVASSLPYIYVTDDRANCGARFLVHYGTASIEECGCFALLTMAAALALIHFYDEEKKPNTRLPVNWLFGYSIVFFVLAFAFVIEVTNQTQALGNPPILPTAVPRLAKSGPIDTHACTELAPSPSLKLGGGQ